MADLNPVQFSTHELRNLKSRDYAGTIGDIEFQPGGESDMRVREIMETAQHEGIKEPLDIRRQHGGMPWLHDGHHRFVAAKRLGIDVPVDAERYYGR